jgi:hypothetical protein
MTSGPIIIIIIIIIINLSADAELLSFIPCFKV